METGGNMARAKSSGPYTVTLFGADNCTIYSDELDTLGQARTRAREYISDPEIDNAHRVEVCDSNDECVFDIFAVAA
jgi:hypothetical protein